VLTLRTLGVVLLTAMALVAWGAKYRRPRAGIAALASAATLGAVLYGRVAWEHGARHAAWMLGTAHGRWADRAAESLTAAALVGVAAALVMAEGSDEGVKTGRVCAALAGLLALVPVWAG